MSSGNDGTWSDPTYWSEAAEQAFARALRRGRKETRFDRLSKRRSTLLSFDELSASSERLPEGHESQNTVSLVDIVGSVGKSELFTPSFYPRSPDLRQRWKRAYAVVRGLRGYEPVELYEADGLLYVVDGHFRISVARTLGHETIEATIKRWR
jgi:hypothetical protein